MLAANLAAYLRCLLSLALTTPVCIYSWIAMSQLWRARLAVLVAVRRKMKLLRLVGRFQTCKACDIGLGLMVLGLSSESSEIEGVVVWK